MCPLRPELLAIGANDPYVRIYDRRMLSLQKAIEGEEGGGSLASWDRYSSSSPRWNLVYRKLVNTDMHIDQLYQVATTVLQV